MSSLLANKKSKVLVIDPSGPVRQMMADTVRNALGFESVEGKASVQDALQHLEVDQADWIILSLSGDQPVTALHLLKICTEHPELKGVRISLCLEESERHVLPVAFEMGLLSYHSKPFTKDSLNEELKAFHAVLEGNAYNEPMTSAHYLRTYLKSVKNHAAQIELEKGLLDLYPGNAKVLLQMVEPTFNLDKKDAAKKTLAQVKTLDPSLADQADELSKKLFGEAAPAATAEGNTGVNLVGAGSVVIVDSDDTVGKAVEDLLKSLGVPSINRFANGEEAWAFLEKNPEPDLMILEWRIPKLSGPLLIQRARHHGFLNVPIIVLSSLLKPEDMPFVREIGVANIIQKPLNKDIFIPGLIWTMQQERLPTEQQSLERKIRHLLKANKKDEAEPLRAQLLADPLVPLAKKRLCEAEFAYTIGNYPLARDAGVESLKLAGDSILVLNLLGKTFMRLSQFEAAMKCFKKAQELSPNNIERLCNMAEVQTELNDHAGAEDTLGDAKTLDPDAKQVTDAEIKVAITRGDTNAAKKIMSSLESLDHIVSYMNNKAVAHAKCGLPKEAIELYQKTMNSVPEDRTETLAIVQYNLALGLVRSGDIEGAVDILDRVLKHKGVKVGKKAFALKTRIKKALEKGTEFKLQSSDAAEQKLAAPAAPAKEPTEAEQAAKLSSEDDHRRMLATVEAKRGDLCCHMIFHNTEKVDDKVKAMLAKPPRFQRRDAIARAEGLGAERAAKAG